MTKISQKEIYAKTIGSDKIWARKISRDRKFVQEKTEKLRMAIKVGDVSNAEIHRTTLLNSNRAKRVAIVELITSGKDIGVTKIADLIGLSEKVTVLEPILEVVQIHAKEKTSKTGYRIIFDFGAAHRVSQRVIGRVLSCEYNKRHFQIFDQGVANCISEILGHASEGFCYAAHLDIRNFYPSFDVKQLHKVLSLDHGVMTESGVWAV